MATGQRLRGLVGQGMSGVRRSRSPVSRSYSPGSYTFTAPTGGWFRFVAFGGGAGASNGSYSGASGALVIAQRPLAGGQRVSITVGGGGAIGGGNGGNTTITMPDGEVITAQGGQGSTGGVGTAKTNLGDVIVNGINGTVTGSMVAGANAPSTTEYIGGSGVALLPGTAPAAGGATDSSIGQRGASGSLQIIQVRLKP